ncbi:hypothetical protein ACHAW5_005018, partial [Stephanodiscus triporus]
EFENFLGKVTSVFIPTEPGTKKHKGFGFVTSAEEAIYKMDRSKLDGRTLRANKNFGAFANATTIKKSKYDKVIALTENPDGIIIVTDNNR